MSLPSFDQPFLTGFVPTSVGKVPRVYDQLSWGDRVGGCKARWGAGRMSYTVEPGLYALGNPGRGSPVLVTANYKMSFDRLRQSLPGRSAWILALDTNGINVWCAAGKGTFGATELVGRMEASRLKEVVTHRDLILPQLAAPGVAAHEVKRLSGFKVTYGPVRSKDLPAFLDGGWKAAPSMRLKTFSFWERLVLIPIELVSGLKAAVVLMAALFIVSGLIGSGGFWTNGLTHGALYAPAVLCGLFSGAVLTPALLPWLPGRAFSLKGVVPGLAGAVFLALLQGGGRELIGLDTLSWMILVMVMASYLAMNFTGASTYTSLSGVRKEMRRALPFQIGGAVLGLTLWVYSLIVF